MGWGPHSHSVKYPYHQNRLFGSNFWFTASSTTFLKARKEFFFYYYYLFKREALRKRKKTQSQSQEPRTQSESLTGLAGSHHWLPIRVHIRKKLDWKCAWNWNPSILIWDLGIPSLDLICCAMIPATPRKYF